MPNNIYDPVDVLTNAIFGQESNWNPDAKTSVTGAKGISQIQPQTWAKYAVPGENINNPTDNASVGRRIIADYYSKYGFDPARISTAYFSGEGNVSPKNSAVPYLQDKPDPTGKKTSSYVQDINKRIAKMSDTQPVSADDILSSFAQTAKPSKNEAVSGEDILAQFKQAGPPPTPNGSRVPVPTEKMTPEQYADYKLGLARATPNPNNNPASLSDFLSSNYHPISAIGQTFGQGTQQISQGMSDLVSNRPANAVGNLGMGVLNATAGSLYAPVSETFRTAGQVVGQPQAAEVASMFLPIKGTASAVSPTIRASNDIIKLVGPENVPEVLRRLENNPNLSLMDVSQPARTVGVGLANNPEIPAAQNVMRKAYETRTDARKDVVQQAVDRTLGPEFNVKEYLDTLKENVKKVGAERINPAIEGAQPIGVMPLVQRLDAVIKAPGTADATINRLGKLKDQLTAEVGSDGFIDPQKLHGIQWRLRAEAENLSKSASGADRNLSGPLFSARNDMVSAIDAASGGKYKPALAGFRDENNVQDAFDKGFSIFKKGGIEDFPEYWRDWAKNAQPAEIAAAKAGAVTATRQQVGAMRGGASRGENIDSVDFVKQRLESIFGPEQVGQLSGLLKDSRDASETNSLLYQGSKTGMTQAGREYYNPTKPGSGGPVAGLSTGVLGSLLMAGGQTEPGLLGLAIGAGKMAHSGLQYAGNMLEKQRATKFANMVSATGGDERNKLIDLLRSNAATGGDKSGNLIPSLVRLAAP